MGAEPVSVPAFPPPDTSSPNLPSGRATRKLLTVLGSILAEIDGKKTR